MNPVIFDFDGTLTKRDTLRPFALFTAKRSGGRVRLMFFYVILLWYKLKIISDKSLKEAFLNLFIAGKKESYVEESARLFMDDVLPGLLNYPVYEKLREHVRSGDDVYIASANYDFLLEPLVEKWNIRGVIATVTEVRGSSYTGNLIGKPCKGEEKTARIASALGEGVLGSAVAYGDGEDRGLLAVVRKGIRVA